MVQPRDLTPETYAQLRDLARHIHAERRGGDTILLHEAWMKLERARGEFSDRRHFVAVAACAMRQIVVDQARRRAAVKRGGDLHRTTLRGVGLGAVDIDVLDLDRALDLLASADPRGAEIVQLRAFGGLSVAEVAAHLNVGTATVERSWRRSWAFLMARLRG